MAKTQILNYYINLHDADLVAQLQAQIDGGGSVAGPYTGPLLALPTGGVAFYRAPDGAAIEFANMVPAAAFPIFDVEDVPVPATEGGFLDGPNFYNDRRYPTVNATFTQSSGWWIFGSTTKFYWAGFPRYVPLASAAIPTGGAEEPVDLADIPTRHFILSGAQQDVGDGFGRSTTSGATIASLTLNVAREASRLGGLFGLQMSNGVLGSVTSAEVNHGGVRSRWDRFNLTIPFAPNSMTGIWRAKNGSSGFGLAVLPTLQVVVLDFTAPATYTVVGSFGDAMTPGRSYKFDCLYDIDSGTSTATFTALRDGETLFTGTRGSGGGANNISATAIGETAAGVTTTAQFIFSDFISADPPKTRDLAVAAWSIVTAYTVGQFVRHGGFTYRCLQNNTGNTPGTAPFLFWRKLKDSIDFQLGSHIQLVNASAFASDHGAWTGDVRLIMQKGGFSSQDFISSVSSGALLSVDTDMANDVDKIPGAIGWVAAQVYAYGNKAAAPSGSLGYKVGAAAAVDTVIAQNVGAHQWNSVNYSLPAGTTQPNPLGTTLKLRHTKAADVATGRIACLMALVEVIGRFTPSDTPVEEVLEDDAVADTDSDDRYPNGFHNCLWPRSPWHTQRDAHAPIIIRGGTYVGSGTGTTISFPLPVAWLLVRPLPNSIVEPVIFWPTIMEGHSNHDQGGDYSTRITRCKQDFNYVSVGPLADQQLSFDVHIGVTGTPLNAVGVTYQYIAFMDPAARFCRAGALVGHDAIAPFVWPLEDPSFTPELLFAWLESSGSTTTNGIYLQGPGHAAGAMQDIDGATVLASAITLGAGQLTVGASWVSPSFTQHGFIGFRRADGNNHPDQAKVMFLGSYTGDGSASRTIGLAPATGLRPLYCQVTPVVTNVTIFRDPSCTTNTSFAMNAGASTATGITAGGIDSFTVGATLNANGVVYMYWGFYGSATAGNGGWSGNGEFIPVPADSPFPTGWTEPTIIEAAVEAPAALVDEPDLEDDTIIGSTAFNVGGLLGGQTCQFYTRAIVNRALHHIGISKRLVNLETDATEEAYQSRDHIKEDINAVLREFDWPFATRYMELVLVGGTETEPVNADWQYSYRGPNAMMKARRIVGQADQRRTYDPNPIAFRLGMDDDGPLVFCNETATDDVPLTLEYTVRHLCPAFYGDALFREALAWKHAASLAMALSRDSRKQAFCLEMYRNLLPRASAPAANEQQQDPDGDASWIQDRN